MANVITVPTPCHEDWNAMTPKDKGRHCGSCCKTVVDFTSWQPQDILLHFKNNKNVCGRFIVDQLNEPIPTQEDFVRQISYFAIPTIKKMAAIFLFAFMIGGSSCVEKSTAAVTQSINNVTKTTPTLIGDTVITPPLVTTTGAPMVVPVKDTTKKKSTTMVMGRVKPVKTIPPPVVPVVPVAPAHIMGEPAMIDTTVIPKPKCTNDPKKNEDIIMGKIIMTTPTKKGE